MNWINPIMWNLILHFFSQDVSMVAIFFSVQLILLVYKFMMVCWKQDETQN